MGRQKQEICIRKRTDSPYYYYKTEYMKYYQSTGKISKRAAYQFALEQLEKGSMVGNPDITLKFFVKIF
jgi:hypothetical protein